MVLPDIPYLDGKPQEWLGVSLKTSPVSNLPLNTAAHRVAEKPFVSSRANQAQPWSARCHREAAPALGKVAAPPHGSELERRRPPFGRGEQWPPSVERRIRAAGMMPSALVPRGSMFEHYVSDPVEPRRSGVYEFCVVGVDVNLTSKALSYYAWEPTGIFDRTFSADEVERKLALHRFARSVALTPKTARAPPLPGGGCQNSSGGATLGGSQACRAHLSEAIRWPNNSSAEGLIHGRRLPEIAEDGRPQLTLNSRFHPRNEVDLVLPVLLLWKTKWANDAKPLSRILVLDASGELSRRLLEIFPGTEILAVDSPGMPSKQCLKSMRDKHICAVREDILQVDSYNLHEADGSFNLVILPFALQRVCGGSMSHYTTLVREALRVATSSVVVCESIEAPLTDQAWSAWKGQIAAELSVPILHEGALPSGALAERLCATTLPSTMTPHTRRFIILQSCATSKAPTFTPVSIGDEVEVCVGNQPRRHWRRGVVQSTSEGQGGQVVRVRRVVEDAREVFEQDISLASGNLRHPRVRILREQGLLQEKQQQKDSSKHAKSIGGDEESLADDMESNAEGLANDEIANLNALAALAISGAVEKVLQTKVHAPPRSLGRGSLSCSSSASRPRSLPSEMTRSIVASEASSDWIADFMTAQALRRLQTSPTDALSSRSGRGSMAQSSPSPSGASIDCGSSSSAFSHDIADEALQHALSVALSMEARGGENGLA